MSPHVPSEKTKFAIPGASVNPCTLLSLEYITLQKTYK